MKAKDRESKYGIKSGIKSDINRCHKYRYLILASIILVAILLRINYVHDDIGTDEGKYIQNIDYPGSTLIPSIMYHMQFITGFNENAVRSLSIFFGLLTIFVFYKIGELKDYRYGLIMASVAALSPTAIVISKSVFLDIYMLFFISCSIYFFMKIQRLRHGDDQRENQKTGQKENQKAVQKSNQRAIQIGEQGRTVQLVIYNILLMLSILATSVTKPQGAVIIVPFIIFGLIKHRSKIFSKPEYYAVILAMIPFVTDYLANPQRFGDLINYFTLAGNAGQRVNMLHKIMTFFSYTWNSDSIYWIIALLGVIMCVIHLIRHGKTHIKHEGNKYEIYEKHDDLFMLIFLTYMCFILMVVLLATYYYLTYLCVFEAFFIAYFCSKLFEDRKSHFMRKYSTTLYSTAIITSIFIILVATSLVQATPYTGNKSTIYRLFADKNHHLFQYHASDINLFLADQQIAVVGGNFGHEYQYYIDKPVFRSCIIDIGIFNVTKAIVTSLPDQICINDTEKIINTWKKVYSIYDPGNNETVDFYEK